MQNAKDLLPIMYLQNDYFPIYPFKETLSSFSFISIPIKALVRGLGFVYVS